jgi:hypothetical protein
MSVFAIAIVLLLWGCDMGAPRSKSGYNYRELESSDGGLFTGPQGSYTVYHRGANAPAQDQPPSPAAHDDKPAGGADPQAH